MKSKSNEYFQDAASLINITSIVSAGLLVLIGIIIGSVSGDTLVFLTNLGTYFGYGLIIIFAGTIISLILKGIAARCKERLEYEENRLIFEHNKDIIRKNTNKQNNKPTE